MYGGMCVCTSTALSEPASIRTGTGCAAATDRTRSEPSHPRKRLDEWAAGMKVNIVRGQELLVTYMQTYLYMTSGILHIPC